MDMKNPDDKGKGKPNLAIIIASKMKDKKEEGKKEDDGGHKELAKMIIDAVKEGDADKLAKDLKSFIKMCCMGD